MLEPGETVVQALRRLKGKNKRQKMSAERKRIFDQLTEDAMQLMENGNYDVYEEQQQSFVLRFQALEKNAYRSDGVKYSNQLTT